MFNSQPPSHPAR